MSIAEFHASLATEEMLELESLRNMRTTDDGDTGLMDWNVWA